MSKKLGAKDFYNKLAKRDALKEQQLILVTAHDHHVFWKNQNNFKVLLAEKNRKLIKAI